MGIVLAAILGLFRMVFGKGFGDCFRREFLIVLEDFSDCFQMFFGYPLQGILEL